MRVWKLPNWNDVRGVLRGVSDLTLPRRLALFSLPEKESSDFCPGDKVCYPDKKAALGEINTLRKAGRKKTERLRAYYCAQCSGWHLTKKMPWGLSS